VGVPHEFIVREGNEKELRAIIREKKVGLVVVEKHGRHGFQRLVMGSVAEQAFREADGLVVTVRPHALPHALLERTTSSKCGKTPGKKLWRECGNLFRPMRFVAGAGASGGVGKHGKSIPARGAS